MPRGPKWNAEENEFLTGILNAYGNKPRKWSEEVRAMVKARLASRSESGIYQQTLKLLKARKDEPVD
ncbi:MAG: hypothetical protein ACXABY_22660, partial [Candidatus Thorarchaeota archaeon]